MSAGLEETPVSYEDLADIEKEFDDVETEIIRQQITLSNPLYERRSKTVSQIPNFWPLVLEQAPPDIDQYIQPSDSALLLSSLLSISVSHFESETYIPGGDPRSVSITWEFAPNEYFLDEKLEKKFWYRRAKDGWCGLVSEPVGIRWKEGRDLTGGLLELVIKAWETEQKASAASSASAKANGKADKERLTPEQKILKRKIENTGMGGLSFFAWFGFIGRKISEEESREAMRIEKEKREKRKAAKSSSEAPESTGEEEEEEEEDEEEGQDPEAEEDQDIDLEIFPDGDDLAIAITEDLWPSAIKYFTQAQEQDALSDADFESDDNEGNAEVEVLAGDRDAENEDRPKKKQRSS
ncbi:related to phosphatase 2a inhibitor [Rhynchosporium secalis]|uniref:Related to phosphatase 2a inhibitor n=1 Tax=Rhynchosporium secalis TaxID=38038 RepID=A0A1E1MK87_RHYSE|nr:related to phosphatase 2a inhibitor [Rhynchosporium secalis]